MDWGFPTRSPLSRGTLGALAAVATAGGWLLTCMGLGLGLTSWPHGTSSAGVLAAIAVVCGALLLAVAAWTLARLTRAWGRLMLVPWAFIVLVTAYPVTIAVAAAFPQVPAEAVAPPAGAENVEMTAADGTRLAGWYVPPHVGSQVASAEGAVVIVRHGAGSTRADTLAQAAVLTDAGFGVLLTDARGHGDSGGRGMDFGWYGDEDIRAAVDLLVTTPGVDPDRIAVLGLSMGGEEAIGAAAADDRIRAVVAEGATWRTAADKTWLSERYGFPGLVQEGLDALTYGLAGALSGAPQPEPLDDAVRDADSARFLLIAAGSVEDEQLVAERLQTDAPDRVEVWAVPGAGHADGLRTDPDEWAARVVVFLDRTLSADAG